MTTIRGQRPAVILQPNSAKKGHSGRVRIFHVSNWGGQKNNKTPSFLRLRLAGKKLGIKILKRVTQMELAIQDIACAAPIVQLVVFDDREACLTSVAG